MHSHVDTGCHRPALRFHICALGTLLLLRVLLPAAGGAEFFVAPRSQPGGDGSRDYPWDLQTALSHPPAVQPGDTIWLRGGVHRLNDRPTLFVSTLAGAPGRPIAVRQFAGERAIIDGNLQQLAGGWVDYQGFEVMYSQTNRCTSETGPFPRAWWIDYDGRKIDFCVCGLDLQAPNLKAINLVIHDLVGGGIGINKSATNAEIYGCLCYYNGWEAPDRAHGHGLYGQNALPSVKTIKDNLFFENLALGLQATGAGPEAVADNFYLEGNAFFMNGILAQSHQANFLVGAFQGIGQNGWIIRNFVYDTLGTMSDSNFGYGGGLTNALVQNNYFGTSALFSTANVNMNILSNVFAAGVVDLDTNRYPNNTLLAGRPAANFIAVRPNQYEAGRANLIIYNWQKLDKVVVDVSGIGLSDGDAFELHNAADYFNDIATGIYHKAPITVPMTGHTVAAPVGANFTLPLSTFPEFGAFVIMKKAIAVVGNAAPAMSLIPDQIVAQDGSLPPLSFTVSNAGGSAGSLIVTAESSDQTLLPNEKLVLGGAGAVRTLALTPAAGQTGTATVTIKAFDGTNYGSSSFGLKVILPWDAPSVSAIADQTINADAAGVEVSFEIDDPEVPIWDLAVAVHSSDQDLVPDANILVEGLDKYRDMVIAPALGRSGVAMITVSASSPFSSASATFAFRVNAWPKISNIPDQLIGADGPSGPIAFTVTDAETPSSNLVVTAEVLAGSVGRLQLELGGSGVARSLTFVPAPGCCGSNTVQLTVSDGLASRSKSFVVTVDPPPAISGISDQTTTVNTAINLPFTVSAPCVPTGQLVVGANSSNGALAPESNILIQGSGGSRSLTIIPAAGQTGTAIITLKASDGISSAATNFCLSVIASSLRATSGPTNGVGVGFRADSGAAVSPVAPSTNGCAPNIPSFIAASAQGGSTSYAIDVPRSGNYFLWCKVLGAGKPETSFCLTLDEAERLSVGAKPAHSDYWQWTRVVASAGKALGPLLRLEKGKHSIGFQDMEPGVKPGRCILTEDSLWKPYDVVAPDRLVTLASRQVVEIAGDDLLRDGISLFGDRLSLTAVSPAPKGALSFTRGKIFYQAGPRFGGTDTFTYTLTDTAGNSGKGTIRVQAGK